MTLYVILEALGLPDDAEVENPNMTCETGLNATINAVIL